MIVEDLLYTAEHEWLATDDAGVATVGITDFATQELGDVVFVQLPEVGSELAAGGVAGEVESTKSVSDLFCPVSGTVTEINEALEDSPELVNTDPFGQGWLFRIKPAQDPTGLLSRQQYLALIED